MKKILGKARVALPHDLRKALATLTEQQRQALLMKQHEVQIGEPLAGPAYVSASSRS
ncbi:hypothetical protein ACIG5C_30180 [Streptomyces werraensis]|uniref:hypothetical protein n=1 Tax=Streptomyces werraensis TaxID=68284 RepID=UPI0037CFC1E4